MVQIQYNASREEGTNEGIYYSVHSQILLLLEKQDYLSFKKSTQSLL